MTEKIRAIGRNILIERIEKKNVTDFGLLIPNDAEKDNFAYAKVISVGNGYYNEKLKKEIKPSVKEGDIILYKPESAMKLEKNILMIIEEHIFGIISDDN